jgi:mannan endo-1,4-beta-mannosidase
MTQKRFIAMSILILVLLLTMAGCGGSKSKNNSSTTVKDLGSFYISSGKLYDPNGNKFIIRGVNDPFLWYNGTSGKAYTSLAAIAAAGANAVRIVWSVDRGTYPAATASMLETIIKRCIALNMIVIPEVHDVTGSDDADKLKNMAEYWVTNDIKVILEKYKSYVLVNIANEWSDSSITDATWYSAYKEAIDVMRDGGITNTLVVDSANYASRSSAILSYGQQLLNDDSLKNLIFSIHMYGDEWNTSSNIGTKLKAITDAKIPVMIGEFGWNSSDSDNLYCQVDAQTVLNECATYDVGYMPWTWSGGENDTATSDCSWLNMTNQSDWTTLTDWGNLCVNGTNGIMATAKVCSVFK